MPHPAGYAGSLELIAAIRRDRPRSRSASPPIPSSTPTRARWPRRSGALGAQGRTPAQHGRSPSSALSPGAIARCATPSTARDRCARSSPGSCPRPTSRAWRGWPGAAARASPAGWPSASTGLDDDPHTRTLLAAIVAARQIEELRCEGFEEFHFYTLNQADVVTAVCRLLDLERRVRSSGGMSRRPVPRAVASPRCTTPQRGGSSFSTAPGARRSRTSTLSEEQFRGERFADHPRPLRGNTDLLCLTRPEVVSELLDAYLAAGADITSTNTFTATTIAQADYGRSAHRARDQRHGGAARTRGRRPLHGRGPRPAALGRRLDRPDQPHALALARRRGPGRPRGRLRQGLRRLPRAGPRAATRAEWTCSSSRRCSTRSTPRPRSRRSSISATRGARAADLDLGDDHRPLGPHAVGADRGGVLDLGPPCRAVCGRAQLRAGRGADAPLCRRARRGGRHAGVGLSNAGLPNEIGEYEEGPARRARSCANGRSPASSTSSAAAAGRRPRTSARSPRRCATSRRASCRRSRPTLRLSGLEPFVAA